MRKHPLLAAALASALPLTAQEPPHHLVHVRIRDAATLEALQRLDLDLAGCSAIRLPAKTVDVIATDADLELLRGAGLDFDVAIRDLEQHHAREAARWGGAPQTLTPPLGQGGMGGHYTLAQVEAILDSFARDYPALCAPKVAIGTSLQGRSIWMVKLSDNPTVDEPEHEVYFDALHHAREPLSMETTLLFMDRLLSGFATDAEARWLLSNRELYFVPVVNPDGYEYNRTTNPNGGGMWRKNRRQNTGGSFGVDLNRNYLTGWTAPNGGNSTSPNSDTYRGTAPFSEPEALALDQFAAGRQFVLTFSTHTYTDVLLRPWGYQVADPPNAADYNRIGQRAVAQNGIQQGQTATLLYIAAGCAIDHHHAARGAYSWTAELGRSNEGGFWPSGPTINDIAERHQHMLREVARMGGSVLALGAVTVREDAGGNNNGRVEPGESGLVEFAYRNDGGASFANDVVATLTAVSSGLQITTGSVNLGRPAKFSTNSSSAQPLRFTVPAAYAGPGAVLELRVSGDGRDERTLVAIDYAPYRVAVDDDFERDRGFARDPAGTATGGRFERATPLLATQVSVTAQPAGNHTPGGSFCWVTDARGTTATQWGPRDTFDVAGGFTELVTPALDLAHLTGARVRFWYWYFDNVGGHALQLDADAGGGWQTIWSTTQSSGGWVQVTRDLPQVSANVRLRWRAQDQDGSIVEALIDDVALEGVQADASLTLLSSGLLGTQARLGLTGQGGASVVLLASGGTASLAIPGIQGNLLLAPAGLVVLPALPVGASGYVPVEVAIPNDPSLRNAVVYFQALHAAGTALRFGNRQALAIR
jgi:hypothetical protein